MISCISSARKLPWRRLAPHVHFQFSRRGLTDTTTTTQDPKIINRFLQLDVVEVQMLTEEVQLCLGMTDDSRSKFGDVSSDVTTETSSSSSASEPVVEAKTTFDLKLVGFQENAKIKVIKEIRSIAGLGLKEAKDLVESVPKIFQKGLKEQEANDLKAKLEALGAVVELS
jgi:large subunit ribosomal protein L7/L12